MIFKIRILYFLVTLSFFLSSVFNLNAQIKKEHLKLGFSYGVGSQNKFPFNSKDYKHEVDFYKLLVNYTLKEKGNWSYEFHIEPSINIVQHQLLNKWFIKPTDSENYEALRELYTQNREITEYVLNLGLLVRYKFYKDLSTYVIGSIGPMTSNKPTERLAKGYAFSDILGLGFSYEFNKILLDFRCSIRHTSNLQFKTPNNGHNTSNIEFGAMFQL
ncbi:acyloxyacyl hydrolase [Seonamhaeicola marinus]|nr:acyloxyacyl hydrolase [Seonamhaeicola marinus]